MAIKVLKRTNINHILLDSRRKNRDQSCSVLTRCPCGGGCGTAPAWGRPPTPPPTSARAPAWLPTTTSPPRRPAAAVPPSCRRQVRQPGDAPASTRGRPVEGTTRRRRRVRGGGTRARRGAAWRAPLGGGLGMPSSASADAGRPFSFLFQAAVGGAVAPHSVFDKVSWPRVLHCFGLLWTPMALEHTWISRRTGQIRLNSPDFLQIPAGIEMFPAKCFVFQTEAPVCDGAVKTHHRF